jgi:hypothetical protein
MLNGKTTMPRKVSSSAATISGPEVVESRFEELVSLQLRVDSRYDLCREAWRRIEALICRELSAYLGCETSRIKMQPESKTGAYLEGTRELGLTVELANGFAPTFRVSVRQFSYSPQGCPAREWRKPASSAWTVHRAPEEPPARVPDAVDLAWTEDICRRFPDVGYSNQRATVVGFTVCLGQALAEITLAHCPQATSAHSALFPKPDWSAVAVGAVGNDGIRAEARHPDTRFDDVGACLVDLLKNSIHTGIETRAKQPNSAAPERPTWL